MGLKVQFERPWPPFLSNGTANSYTLLKTVQLDTRKSLLRTSKNWKFTRVSFERSDLKKSMAHNDIFATDFCFSAFHRAVQERKKQFVSARNLRRKTTLQFQFSPILLRWPAAAQNLRRGPRHVLLCVQTRPLSRLLTSAELVARASKSATRTTAHDQHHAMAAPSRHVRCCRVIAPC